MYPVIVDGVKMIWKDIKGYVGIYKVSDTGLVKSLDRTITHRNYDMQRKGKIVTPRKDRGGYLYLCLCKNANLDYQKVHRIVANTFLPNPYNKTTVNHKDGIKDNNNISNLEWNTIKENNIHRVKIHKLFGENHPSNKLTTEDVLNIRELYDTTNTSYAKLAKKFKVSDSNIRFIIIKKIWRHI